MNLKMVEDLTEHGGLTASNISTKKIFSYILKIKKKKHQLTVSLLDEKPLRLRTLKFA